MKAWTSIFMVLTAVFMALASLVLGVRLIADLLGFPV